MEPESIFFSRYVFRTHHLGGGRGAGGHILKLFYYLGITTMSSGLALLLVPSVVTMMFAGG